MGQSAGSLLRLLDYRHAAGLRSKAVLGHVLCSLHEGCCSSLSASGEGHKCPKPFDALIAWCAPRGLVVMLAGYGMGGHKAPLVFLSLS